MTAEEPDLAAARLEQIATEWEKLRSELQEQVEEFGFTPPMRGQVKKAHRHDLPAHGEPRTHH